MISTDWIDKQITFLASRLGIYLPEAGRDFFFNHRLTSIV